MSLPPVRTGRGGSVGSCGTEVMEGEKENESKSLRLGSVGSSDMERVSLREEESESVGLEVEVEGLRRDSEVPKMRLSGGLAEMGELSLHDTRQGWPIYWR